MHRYVKAHSALYEHEKLHSHKAITISLNQQGYLTTYHYTLNV